MKKSTERLLVGGIILTGLIALFTSGSALGKGTPAMPATFHPELRPIERAFVWDEVNNNTGASMQARASVYMSSTLSDGSKLSPAALAALGGEALIKQAAGT